MGIGLFNDVESAKERSEGIKLNSANEKVGKITSKIRNNSLQRIYLRWWNAQFTNQLPICNFGNVIIREMRKKIIATRRKFVANFISYTAFDEILS
jgi:hypothetical protein